jgi:hypothetical protein
MMIINEEIDSTANIDKGIVDVNAHPVRDAINNQLAQATSCGAVTPYIVLQKVRKILAQFHISLPPIIFLEGEHGVETVEIRQFGDIMGMNNAGEVVTKAEYPYHLYFEYQMNSYGMYDVFCEIVNEEDLEELLDAAESEFDDEDEDK